MSAEAAAPPALERQAHFNRTSAGNWDLFSGHRRRVTDLLLAGAPAPPGRLCVLGAGNCCDLVLAELAEAYAAIELVDLDEQALRRGLRRQNGERHGCITLLGGVDLSGGAADLAGTRGPGPSSAALDSLRQRLERGPRPAQQPHDVVASANLLSPIIDSVVAALGADHPRTTDLVLAARNHHLRLLSGLVAPGGRGILFLDVVSSDTCEELAAAAESDLPGVLRRAIARRNIHKRNNPLAIMEALARDPAIGPHVGEVTLHAPWRWQLSVRRSYLACAVSLRKAAP